MLSITNKGINNLDSRPVNRSHRRVLLRLRPQMPPHLHPHQCERVIR